MGKAPVIEDRAPEGSSGKRHIDRNMPTEGMPQAANGKAVERHAGHADCSRAQSKIAPSKTANGRAVERQPKGSAAAKQGF